MICTKYSGVGVCPPRLIFMGVIFVLALYVAIQSFAVTASWFVADDAQELAFVRSMEHWWQLFGVDSFGLFRPVKNLLFFTFAALEPFGIVAIRSLAIAIGLLSFFPVRAFFRRVFADERFALLGAAIWILSPTLVSSVAWLSCVNIQLMCAFAAGAFVCHDKNRPIGAALLLFFSCVSYECAVAVGPAIVVFDFFLCPERFRSRRGWLCYVFYAVVTLGFLALRHVLGGVHSVNGSFANCTRLDIVLASGYFTCQHFLSWLWPFGRFAVFGGYAAGRVPMGLILVCWAIVGLTAVLALVLRRRNPIVGFGLTLALVGFLPVSNLTGVGNGPYGDYYLGIASFGLSIVVCALCHERIWGAILLTLRAAAVVAAVHWAWLWADGDRAFFASAENFPEFFGNKLMLVTRLADAGMYREALQVGENVEGIVGHDSGQMYGVYLARGLYELCETKNAERALYYFEKSRKNNDFNGPLCNRDYYKGCVYDDVLNDAKRAEELYVSSLRGKWTMDSIPAADRLARLLALRGEREQAIALWQRALKMQPNNTSIRHNLNVTVK